MSRSMKQKRARGRNVAAILLTVLLVAVLVGAALWLRQSDAVKNKSARAMTYNYTSGAGTVTCGVGNGMAAASTSGLQVYDRSGLQTVGELYVARTPVLTSCGEYGLAYDIGSEQLLLFTEEGLVSSLKADGGVISAGVNASGWCAVCAEESGYKGAVTVFDRAGTVVYKWLSGTAYLLAARVSDDGKTIAVLTLTDSGSRVLFLQVNSDELKGEVQLEGELLLDMGFGPDGSLYGLSADGLYIIKPENRAVLVQDYTEDTLAGYSFDGGPVLALKAHRSGGSCRVLVLQDGEMTELCHFDENLLSLSGDKSHVALLTEAGLTIYGRDSGEVSASYPDIPSCQQIWLTGDGNVIATARHTAAVYAVKEAE